MYRGSLLKIPCYRLMFFNGIIDIVELMVTSNIMAFFHFTGAVFCSSMVLSWIMGHLGYSKLERSRYHTNTPSLLCTNYTVTYNTFAIASQIIKSPFSIKSLQEQEYENHKTLIGCEWKLQGYASMNERGSVICKEN
ncbi:unnamed protein product [Cylicocyclus nassatus]|uniref:Uncharacterized protein n=1 Tax=Cylicocyclus nassatus TaxID=53992 RepID=A0AA36H4R0_CYLNA|nr:unnamed protein product [Cylicocyclus nassatus]